MNLVNNCRIKTKDSASFRDPSGFVYTRDDVLLRQVNQVYEEDYRLLMKSGLYNSLVDKGFLVSHSEESLDMALSPEACAVLKPEFVPFISYPDEWCFSQLKDAALLTLEVQKLALESGMSLKDASAYNIQFLRSRPIFIDTLSFEKYREGEPWVAYRQFCRHFLAPLTLMAYRDTRLNQLFRVYIDGIPLDLAGSLLPWHTKMNLSLLTHIHLHAGSENRFAGKKASQGAAVSKMSLMGLLDNLEGAIRNMKLKKFSTTWSEYYDITNYSEESFENKKSIVKGYLRKLKCGTTWDLGANTGVFSKIASEFSGLVISMDIDPLAVEKNYLEIRNNKEENILPLLVDVTNPHPGCGWECVERKSLLDRGGCHTALALALIHHLAIGNNLPLDRIAGFFAGICDNLVVEFVPKTDSYVQKMLSTRKDIFENYTHEAFIKAFNNFFNIESTDKIEGSERILHLMSRRKTNG
jgi:hypothetical protein